jgi:hypothetical protein
VLVGRIDQVARHVIEPEPHPEADAGNAGLTQATQVVETPGPRRRQSKTRREEQFAAGQPLLWRGEFGRQGAVDVAVDLCMTPDERQIEFTLGEQPSNCCAHSAHP